MMRSTVDLPEPFRPSSPILAPGKKEREMSLMICRLGGTTLLTRNIDITYWAMAGPELSTKAGRPQGAAARPPAPGPAGFRSGEGSASFPGSRRGARMGLWDSLGIGRKGEGAVDAPARPPSAPPPRPTASTAASPGRPTSTPAPAAAAAPASTSARPASSPWGATTRAPAWPGPQDCRATCDLCATRCPEEGISFPGRQA